MKLRSQMAADLPQAVPTSVRPEEGPKTIKTALGVFARDDQAPHQLSGAHVHGAGRTQARYQSAQLRLQPQTTMCRGKERTRPSVSFPSPSSRVRLMRSNLRPARRNCCVKIARKRSWSGRAWHVEAVN